MEPLRNDRLVLVTGATGFVAGHVIKVLLEAKYHVRGTVRKVADTKKYEHLQNLPGATPETLQFVECDLNSTRGWDEACKGCTYLMHVASPFPATAVKNEELELIKPAVEGTLIALEAAVKAGIKKAVVTSSCAAISYGHKAERYITSFSEKDWSDLTGVKGYEKSKTLAEKAVWDFHAKHGDKIEIATINPALILGPTLSKNTFTSGDIIEKMLKGDYPALPKVSIGVVDVRDVATAHLLALENPKSNGQRYLLSEKTLWFGDIGQILGAEFKKYGYKIPSTVVGKCPVWMMSIFDKQAKLILDSIGIFYRFDNSKSVNELGIKYRPIETSLVEMGYSLIECGSVPNKLKGKK